MGFAFRIMIWVIAFNLAVGIVAFAFGQNLGENNYNGIGDNEIYKGVNQTTLLYSTFNTSAGVPVEESSFWYRFLDVISLGFYNKIMLFMDSTIFAIPTLLDNSGLLGDNGELKPYINGIIMLIFVLGMFEIFTGKDLTVR